MKERQVKQLREELETVDWYTKVLESGVVTKELYEDMVRTKKKIQDIEEKMTMMTFDHEVKVSQLSTKLKETQRYLIKTNNEVVKPLMHEIKLVEELKQRYKTQYEKNFEDLRILNAIMRLPRMSDQFYKTIKKREQQEKFEQRKKEAIYLMDQYVTQGNDDEFFNKFIGHLDKTVPEQMNNPIEKRHQSSSSGQASSQNEVTSRNASQKLPRYNLSEKIDTKVLETNKQISLNEKIRFRRHKNQIQHPETEPDLL